MPEMDKKKNGGAVLVSFIVLCLCLMVPNYAQYQVSPLGTIVIEQYGMSLPQLSTLFSAPMIPAIFFSLIGGLLIDKLGAKSVIGAGLILTVVGCLWRVVCGSFTPLFAATLLTGFSACFINAGSGKIIGSLYGPENVPAKMGVLMAASTGAMTIANFTTAYFPTVTSAFTASAIFACAATLLWFLFVKTPKITQPVGQNSDKGPGMAECLKVAIKNSGVWCVSFSMFSIMAANVVIGSFLPTALGARGISATTAGTMAAFYTIGNFLGCFVAPACIKVMHSQKKVLILFSILAAVGVAFSWSVPNTVMLAIALLLTGTFLGGMIPTLMSLPVQFSSIGPVYAGTAGGVIGTIQLLGAVLVPSYVLAPIAGDDFVLLFIMSGACMLIAGFFSAIIREVK
jgi:NNP family nitrate/nitrite transporter-like MFS transporter